jgi:hypothetical protein
MKVDRGGHVARTEESKNTGRLPVDENIVLK